MNSLKVQEKKQISQSVKIDEQKIFCICIERNKLYETFGHDSYLKLYPN